MSWPPRVEDLQRSDGAVVIPARTAGMMIALLTFGVTEAINKGYPVKTDALIVLDAIREAAELEEQRQSSDLGTASDELGRLDTSGGQWMTTAEAAGLVGCTARALTQAISRGRLPARRVGWEWLIRDSDLEHYRHNRSRNAKNPS